MNPYSPFDDLEDRYISGENWEDRSPHIRHAYLDLLDGDEIEAQRWFACGISPADARRFIAMAMDPEEAQSWGLNASMVERFRALHFNKSEAQEWALAGIWPDHAFHWRRAQMFTPQVARELINHSTNPSAALAWTVVKAHPWQIRQWAKAGLKPGPMLIEQLRRRAPRESET